MFDIDLCLFGGRGGGSGMGGGKELGGLEALANGVMDEDLTENQDREVKEYLMDFLRSVAKLKDGQDIEADQFNDYTRGVSLESMISDLELELKVDPDTGKVDPDCTAELWDYDRRITVSYDTAGNKMEYYEFDDPSDFTKLHKDLTSGRVKGIIWEDGYGQTVAGKGITVLSPKDDAGSAFFRFEAGKLPKRSK